MSKHTNAGNTINPFVTYNNRPISDDDFCAKTGKFRPARNLKSMERNVRRLTHRPFLSLVG